MTFKTKICVCNNGYCNTDMWIHDCIINKKKAGICRFFLLFFYIILSGALHHRATGHSPHFGRIARHI